MQTSYLDGDRYKKMMGVYFREQRELLHMNYSQLSKKSGIAPQRLKKIESGEIGVRATTIDKLMAPLQLKEDYLEKIKQVANIAFVHNLYEMLSSSLE